MLLVSISFRHLSLSQKCLTPQQGAVSACSVVEKDVGPVANGVLRLLEGLSLVALASPLNVLILGFLLLGLLPWCVFFRWRPVLVEVGAVCGVLEARLVGLAKGATILRLVEGSTHVRRGEALSL